MLIKNLLLNRTCMSQHLEIVSLIFLNLIRTARNLLPMLKVTVVLGMRIGKNINVLFFLMHMPQTKHTSNFDIVDSISTVRSR